MKPKNIIVSSTKTLMAQIQKEGREIRIPNPDKDGVKIVTLPSKFEGQEIIFWIHDEEHRSEDGQ